MAKNNRQFYKRSAEAPVALTEQHKKDAHALEVTSNIIKYALIAVVLLTLLFGMLPLVTPEVTSDKVDQIPGEHDKFANISFYDLINGWFDTASFDYADRDIHIGRPFMHAFDYIVERVPVLKEAVSKYASMGGSEIFEAIEPETDTLLNTTYFIMLTIEIISLVWVLVMALVFVLSFVKKFCPTQTIINVVSLIHIVLTSVMFIFTLALSANSTKDFVFNIGIGMWLNILIAVLLGCVLIANVVYKAKVKNHEELAASLRR